MKKLYSLLTVLCIAPSIFSQTAVLFKDLNSGAGDANFLNPKLIAEKLYFAASNGTDGLEPWVSDGTPDGTYMLKNINEVDGNSAPREFTEHNGKVYFTANDGIHGRELWVTDGTESGTQLIKDINPNTTDDGPVELKSGLGYLFFRANDGVYGAEPWKSNGTMEGTTMIVDYKPGPSDSAPQNFIEYAGRMYFAAVTEFLGAEPSYTDGTAAGTAMLKDIAPGTTQHGGLASPMVHNGLLFFVGYTQNIGYELWTSDGTTEGTVRINDFYPGTPAGASGMAGMFVYDNNLYYCGRETEDYNWQLWQSDGTLAGTMAATDDAIEYAVSARDLKKAFVFNNKIYYYQSIASNGGNVMWASDGTAAGTAIATPIPTGTYNWSFSAAALNDTLYYIDRNFTNNQLHVWKSLGDAASAQMLAHPAGSNADAISYTTGWLGVVGGRVLYYAKHNTAIGYELYTLGEVPSINVDEHKATSSINVYPNPATDVVRITLPERGNVSIYNATGMLLESITMNTNHTLDISNYAQGIYIIKSNDEVVRFIKE